MPVAGTPLARIGPNAILQLLAVLEARGGPRLCERVMSRAGIASLPDCSVMIDECIAVSLHHAVRAELSESAEDILREAGERTAAYILAHRIPPLAQRILKILPPPLSARLLSGAITRHAWTFAGSAGFRTLGPYGFELTRNPFAHGAVSDQAVCGWHAAVFAGLNNALVSAAFDCTETSCIARGDPSCRFELTRKYDKEKRQSDGIRRRLSAPFGNRQTGPTGSTRTSGLPRDIGTYDGT